MKKKSIVRSTDLEPITGSELAQFDTAMRFFNKELWDGALPHCELYYLRKPGMRGYFKKAEFRSRDGAGNRSDGIALNPDDFPGRTDEQILSVLVHEQAHQWRHLQSNDATTGYHDRTWSRQMFKIGLNASHTGKPGGKPNGYRMDHFIIPGGKYQKAYEKLVATTGLKINWESLPPTKAQKKKTESKTKYSCDCGLNVWGKPGIVDLKHGTHSPMEAKKAKP
jgi:predicted SprT family Zn-dependent metalloprotease